MKLPKNVTMTPNGLYRNFPIVQGNEIKWGYWIGAVEVVVDGYQDEDGWEYVTEHFLAFQLKSGRIVYVESPFGSLNGPFELFSLKGKMFSIEWGYYPVDFPEEWKYCSLCSHCDQAVEPVETDQLPF